MAGGKLPARESPIAKLAGYHYNRLATGQRATMSLAPLRIAILDDYQHISLKLADWSRVLERARIDVFDETLLDEDAIAARLEPYAIVCTMRERTRFTASLFKKLPSLRLLTTTGLVNRSIDLKAAQERGIIVAGTKGRGNSTLEHIWTLILATVRFLVQEDANVKASKPMWQSTLPMGLGGRTLGLLGAGKLGQSTAKVPQMLPVGPRRPALTAAHRSPGHSACASSRGRQISPPNARRRQASSMLPPRRNCSKRATFSAFTWCSPRRRAIC